MKMKKRWLALLVVLLCGGLGPSGAQGHISPHRTISWAHYPR
jgi:hypothetical protein